MGEVPKARALVLLEERLRALCEREEVHVASQEAPIDEVLWLVCSPEAVVGVVAEWLQELSSDVECAEETWALRYADGSPLAPHWSGKMLQGLSWLLQGRVRQQ